MQYIPKVIVAIFSILLVMIGLDKFFNFLTPCTLLNDINPTIWKILGGIQLVMGLQVWNVKWQKPIAWLILGLMIYFIVRHSVEGTTDFGGAGFMAILAILIIWNPFQKAIPEGSNL